MSNQENLHNLEKFLVELMKKNFENLEMLLVELPIEILRVITVGLPTHFEQYSSMIFDRISN